MSGDGGNAGGNGQLVDDEGRQEVFQAVTLAYHISSWNMVEDGKQNDNDVFRTLEEFCNPKMMSEPRKPLAVVGRRGCGKSALLASWIGHRKMNNPNKKDLIIYHFAGCNTPSKQVRNFLYRCCLRMRDFFRLKSEVTFDEEHLTWDFPRMLEFCAAKGRIIIVVDGLEMLKLVERRDNLRWLPTVFPPNVRVVMSFSEPSVKLHNPNADQTFLTAGDPLTSSNQANDGEGGEGGGGSGEGAAAASNQDGEGGTSGGVDASSSSSAGGQVTKKQISEADIRLNRLSQELLTRRGLAVIHMDDMDSASRIVLCKAFCEKKEYIVDPSGGAPEQRGSDSDGAGSEDDDEDDDEDDGGAGEPRIPLKVFEFYIFEKTFRQLVEHPLLSKSTHCLVMVFKMLRLTAKWNLDLWGVLAKLLKATSEFELIQAIVDLWENGLPMGSSEAQRTAGGISALRREATMTGKRRSLRLVDNEDLDGADIDAQLDADPSAQSYTEVVLDDEEIELPRAPDDLDALPSYLDGGATFEGFGPPFRSALGLLCAAHYGLRAGELWAMLEIAGQEVTDHPADNRRRFLQALEPLGLRVILGKLLVLPPSLTGLPQVVASLYGDDHFAKTKRRMSSHICMFFKNQPRSYRRMEELPFALEFCGKWRELKSEITNMHTFRLMCESGCFWCASLTRFWRMLASGIRSKNDDWNLGNPSGRHYDPVDEFARALMVFVRDENPPTADITYLSDLILHFFEDFARFESRVPDFLHPPLDHASLANINLTGKDISGKAPYYFYKRWLWVMFPWLALGTLDEQSGGGGGSAGRGGGSGVATSGDGKGEPGDVGSGSATPTAAAGDKSGGGGSGGGSGGGGGTEYVSIMKKSFWATKKVPPSKGPAAINSVRLNARLNASSPSVQVSEHGADALKPRKPSGSERKADAVSRSDRVVDYGAEIPFSAPTTRAKKHGSRFPSVEANLREKGLRLTPIFSGGVIPADKRSLPSTATDTSVHLQNLPAHLTSYPVTVTDAKRAEAAGMLMKLREKHDKLMYESNKLQQQLAELRLQVSEREKQDAFTEKCLQTGEQYMTELEARMVKVNTAVERAKRTTTFYTRVLGVCEKNPFQDKVIVNERDKLAQDCKAELHAAMKRLSAAEFELRQLSQYEKPKLEKELRRSRKLQQTVLQRLEDVHKHLEKDREETRELNHRRSAILAEVAGDLNFKEERRLKALTTQQTVYNKHLSKTATNFKHQLGKYQAAFEKIVKATGLSDPDAIFSKYMNKDAEEAQLIKQHQEYKAKLASLQQQKEALQKDLENESVGAQVVTSRQIRHIDDLNFEAENQLKRNHAKFAQARALLKDVKSGILHLAHMMDIGRHSSIEQLDLLPVLRLMHNKLLELKKSSRQQATGPRGTGAGVAGTGGAGGAGGTGGPAAGLGGSGSTAAEAEHADSRLLAKISKEMMVPQIVGRFEDEEAAGLKLGMRVGDTVVDKNYLDTNLVKGSRHDAIVDVEGMDQGPGLVLTRSAIKEASKASEKRLEKDRRKKERSSGNAGKPGGVSPSAGGAGGRRGSVGGARRGSLRK